MNVVQKDLKQFFDIVGNMLIRHLAELDEMSDTTLTDIWEGSK